MALRVVRGTELRRAARGSAGFVVLAVALYAGAALWATWPAVQHAGGSFLADGAPGHGETAPGDHLQTAYRLWLPGHQLENGGKPWVDPYTFTPESSPSVNFEAWPYSIPYWPLQAALGTVGAWNAFVLLTFVGAGLLACWWLRELGLPRGPALAGGLAFAIAPYRVAQTTGHLLGPISLMLPLALAAFERARRGSTWWLVLSGAALTTIPLSGQVHLSLGAIPFYCLYALCRTREPRLVAGVAGGMAAALLAGVLYQQASIAGSIGERGRSLDAVSSYSADAVDLVSRHVSGSPESFVFLGWLLPVLAVAGLVVLGTARRWGLAAALGIGAVVPILLALGTHLPLYEAIWRGFPPLRYARVPERLMPIACLALAGLAAFAVDRLRWSLVAPLAIVLLAADLHVHVVEASAADTSNAAYARLDREPPGRLLELPVFFPDRHYASVYSYYGMAAPRGRPLGYSTLAPLAADRTSRRLLRLNCGDWTGGAKEELDRLGVRYIAFHRGVFPQLQPSPPQREWLTWHGLQQMGFRPVTTGGEITLFERDPKAKQADPPMREPKTRKPIYCGGWFGPTKRHPRIRTMRWTHAPVWVKGSGTLIVLASAALPLQTTFSVDGKVAARELVSAVTTVRLKLRSQGWHLVTIDVPHLIAVDGRPLGLDVIMIHRRVKIVP